MVLDAVSNFVRGNTDAEVGTSDTTVSVVDASIFPDPSTDGKFNVVIWDVDNFPRPDQDGDVEILRVTARDTGTNELTVTRGQEMTSAAAHPEGSAIHLSPTAKMFSDIESTFGDFWDAGTQELTADVNNTNTTTTALEAESVSTERANITDEFVSLFAETDTEYNSLEDALENAGPGVSLYLTQQASESDLTVDRPLFLEGKAGRKNDSGARETDDENPILTYDNTNGVIKDTTIRNDGSEAGLVIDSVITSVLDCHLIGDPGLRIESGASRNSIRGCRLGGSDIVIDGDDNAVIGNVEVGTITDNGSGNEVANNS